jgi:hypothetical protein
MSRPGKISYTLAQEIKNRADALRVQLGSDFEGLIKSFAGDKAMRNSASDRVFSHLMLQARVTRRPEQDSVDHRASHASISQVWFLLSRDAVCNDPVLSLAAAQCSRIQQSGSNTLEGAVDPR